MASSRELLFDLGELQFSKPSIIIESPTKIETSKKRVGKSCNVAARAGHISRDLPVETLGASALMSRTKQRLSVSKI